MPSHRRPKDPHDWRARHRAAEQRPTQGEKAILQLIDALNYYQETHRDIHGSQLAEDGVLGERWIKMVRGAIGLLNGDLGRLDGGTLDAHLRSIAIDAGFDENLE
jgi:hypothetical protein